MDELICSAINSKRVIQFYYDEGFRTVEPFSYGINTAGNEVLRGYQIGGFSESGNSGWRLFRLVKISNLTLTSDHFDLRPDYTHDDLTLTTIYCRV